ncbi:hypothetical protein Y696_01160 [Mesotoga sp. H07pep.5.4]|uniref:iron chaperone n=1 Tax=Mesotoga sp. H07pep.5.4 TaxID=1463664 RepID=UPI000EF14B3D|nr:hypothetical protein Y696_01160 [Mesotoga sp. H07pep.5.4]
MRQCPKCGREFEKENQKHSCGEPLKTIDSYIEAQPESVRPFLHKVRDTLCATLADSVDRISRKIPTYWKKRNIIRFAAIENHIGLYPGDKAVAHFADRLTEFSRSKGAIQFQYGKPMPPGLIAETAEWCYKNNEHH